MIFGVRTILRTCLLWCASSQSAALSTDVIWQAWTSALRMTEHRHGFVWHRVAVSSSWWMGFVWFFSLLLVNALSQCFTELRVIRHNDMLTAKITVKSKSMLCSNLDISECKHAAHPQLFWSDLHKWVKWVSLGSLFVTTGFITCCHSVSWWCLHFVSLCVYVCCQHGKMWSWSYILYQELPQMLLLSILLGVYLFVLWQCHNLAKYNQDILHSVETEQNKEKRLTEEGSCSISTKTSVLLNKI